MQSGVQSGIFLYHGQNWTTTYKYSSVWFLTFLLCQAIFAQGWDTFFHSTWLQSHTAWRDWLCPPKCACGKSRSPLIFPSCRLAVNKHTVYAGEHLISIQLWPRYLNLRSWIFPQLQWTQKWNELQERRVPQVGFKYTRLMILRQSWGDGDRIIFVDKINAICTTNNVKIMNCKQITLIASFNNTEIQ